MYRQIRVDFSQAKLIIPSPKERHKFHFKSCVHAITKPIELQEKLVSNQIFLEKTIK